MRAFLVLAAIAMTAVPAAAREEILSYVSTIAVGNDGVMDVTETIKVRAERQQIRRGIYRDFPTRLMREDGLYQKTGFKVVEILKNGKPEPWHQEWQGPGTRVYIGSKDVLIPRGDYTYTIRYRTTRQLRFFADHDELYWNVTGNFWSFPILRAEARVTLPEGAHIGELNAFTGRFGQSGRDYSIVSQHGNRFVVRTTRQMSAGEGLTILATFQKGLVPEPGEVDKLRFLIFDNIGMVILVFGAILLLGFYLYTWEHVGRDPQKGTIIPLFEPPPGVSPAAASFLHFWGFRKGSRKPLAFIAAVVSLAVKGCIRLKQDGKTLTLEPVADFTGDLSPGEAVIARNIGGRRGGMAVSKANAKSVTRMREAFRDAVSDDYDERFIRNNTGYVVLGAIISIALFVGFFLLQMPLPEHSGPLFLAAIGGVFAALLFFLGLGWVADLLPGGGPAVLGAVYMLAGSAIWAGIGIVAAKFLPPVLVVAALLLVLIGSLNVVMYHLLRAPTVAGRDLLDRIEGFKLYLSVAEAERMNLAGAPEVNEQVFEKFLPYAIGLGVEKPWSDAFSGHVARIGDGSARSRSQSVYQPGWYSGGRFNAASLSAATGSMVTAMSSSIARATPSRSGSGGGGFSGGGGGGGGGGGW